MKKIAMFLIFVVITGTFSGCKPKSLEQPQAPIEGLLWGMPMEGALKVLKSEQEYTLLPKNGTLQPVSVKGKYKLSYGVELEELTLIFKDNSQYLPGDTGLIEITGKCTQQNLSQVMNTIGECFRGDYFPSLEEKDSTKIYRWQSRQILELPDRFTIEKNYADLLKKFPNIEMNEWPTKGRTDMNLAPFVKGELIYQGEEKGNVRVSGRTQVMVRALRGMEK